ncbi:hypothetical protein Mal64_16020 [Pseudobythopirellula maris]|uniref:Uncharacterized protein n=1 Tax=Pseudobythopirellula maris TaxID=2527991 RepID=A0A5C5ZLW0_9BACT|nr:hypothetical protein [Pseudobythopirellula maris]TWT88130.1 hypothetical protein Mal64_16020 [Pseudobythopirellula maris]
MALATSVCTPLLARLRSAASVYTTLPWVLVGLGLWLAVLAVASAGATAGRGHTYYYSMILNFAWGAAFTVPLAVAVLAKRQFATPAARLVPGYRAPHLGVPVAVVAVSLAAAPPVAAWLLSVDPIGLTAFCATVGALALVGQHAGTLASVAVLMSLFGAAWLPAVGRWWLAPSGAEGAGDLARVGVLLVSWSLVGVWLQRLATLNAERRDYQGAPLAAAYPCDTHSGRVEQGNFAPGHGRVHAPYDKATDRLLADSPRPAQLLRCGYSPLESHVRAGWVFVYQGALFTAALVMYGPALDRLNDGMIVYLLLMFACFVPASAAGKLAQRRPQMERELLLPMTRRDYMRGVLTPLVWDAAWLWLAHAALLVYVIGVFRPDLASPAMTAVIAPFALFSLACNVFVGGWEIYLASYRIGLLRGALTLVASFLTIAAVTPWWLNRESVGGLYFIVAAGVFALAGVVLTRLAWRRWLNAGLG